MCGYDPFYWYEKYLDEEYEMNQLGFDNYDDYLDYKCDQKEQALLEQAQD